MKYSLISTVFITGLLIGSSQVSAGSNNGYTSAANVYTGSASRTWFGAGVAHVLAEWKNERAEAESAEAAPVTEEAASVEVSADAESSIPASGEAVPVADESAAAPDSPTPPDSPVPPDLNSD